MSEESDNQANDAEESMADSYPHDGRTEYGKTRCGKSTRLDQGIAGGIYPDEDVVFVDPKGDEVIFRDNLGENQTMHTVELTDQEAYDAIEMLDHYADEMDADRADELADKIEAAVGTDGGNPVPSGTPQFQLKISEDSADQSRLKYEVEQAVNRLEEDIYGR